MKEKMRTPSQLMQSVLMPSSRQWRRPYTRGRRSGEGGMLVLLGCMFGGCLVLSYVIMAGSDGKEGTLRTLPEEKGEACDGVRPVYVFVHLHKTGGNSMKKVLFGFAKRNSLKIFHTCHGIIQDSLLKALWFGRRKKQDGVDCNLDELVDIPKAEREKIDIIMGHQFVGVHTMLEGQDTRYFTFLREPVMRKTAHFLHFEKEKERLVAYLLQKNRNYMTKRLATATTSSEVASDLRAAFVDVDAFAMRAALRAAKNNLATRFFFVGIHERYTESVCVLTQILNTACGRGSKLALHAPLRLEKVLRVRENQRGETAHVVKNLGPTVKAAVLEVESADIQLYKYALRLFEDKLQRYPECRQVVGNTTTQQ